MKKRLMALLLALVMTAGLFPQAAFAADAGADGADAGGQPYERTIMMYVCGSDLEPKSGLASYNLRQILRAGFSKDDQVKLIVMTGGSTQWMLESEYLYDPETGEQP